MAIDLVSIHVRYLARDCPTSIDPEYGRFGHCMSLLHFVGSRALFETGKHHVLLSCSWNMKELIAVLQIFDDVMMELVALRGRLQSKIIYICM